MKMLMTLTAILTLSLTIGCASVGRKLDQSKVAQIHKGTTKSEVLSLIGSPDQITRSGDATIFQYTYFKATAKAINFVPVVGAFAGGANTQNQSLTLRFDDSDKVTEITSTYGGMESDTGLSTGGSATMEDVTKNKRQK